MHSRISLKIIYEQLIKSEWFIKYLGTSWVIGISSSFLCLVIGWKQFGVLGIIYHFLIEKQGLGGMLCDIQCQKACLLPPGVRLVFQSHAFFIFSCLDRLGYQSKIRWRRIFFRIVQLLGEIISSLKGGPNDSYFLGWL